ncbi:hypothetical protein DFJ77DRAFT_478681 [Powellomyces hirtus]|nr:hypothetical protein DFJ77DRAFT_478681 [Powellomyces hirtus]
MDLDSRSLQRIPSGSDTEFHPQRHQKSWRSRLTPRDRWGKAAIIWATLQLLAIVVLEAIIAKVHKDYHEALKTSLGTAADQTQQNPIADANALTIYHSLFIVAQVTQWVLVADALWNSSTIQMISTTVFNFALFAYSALQFRQADDIGEKSISLNVPGLPAAHPTSTWEVVTIIAMGVFCLGWFVITQRLYRVFGWSIFKNLGADISVRNRLKMYHVYMMLLKLDVFFFVGFDIQFLALVILNDAVTQDESDKWTHGLIAIPLTIGLLVIAFIAVRRESKVMMTATLLGLSGGIGYLIAKLVDVAQKGATSKYSGSRKSLTFFESITLALSIATFIVAILNFRNFGKGLKEQLNKARGRDLELDDIHHNAHKEAPRWSLE